MLFGGTTLLLDHTNSHAFGLERGSPPPHLRVVSGCQSHTAFMTDLKGLSFPPSTRNCVRVQFPPFDLVRPVPAVIVKSAE